MYTAKSVGKSIANGTLSVTVEYTDGKDTLSETYQANSGIDPQWLENRVRNKLLSLNTLSDLADATVLGSITPRTATPTATDLWLADLDRLKKMTYASTLGLIDTTAKAYTDQVAKVKSGFKPSYIDYLRA